MAEKISVQIALEGGAQVEKQLVGIGAAGQTMADGIAEAGKASQTTGGDFDALIEATNKLTEATNKATEAHSGLSLETVKTSAEIAKLAAEIGLAGVEIVQAVRHHNTLIQTLIKLVGITNTTVKAVSLLSPELALVGVAIGSTAAAVATGAVAFEAAEKIITKFAASTEKINNTLQTLAATSGESFDKLQLGEAAFEQIGIKAETFRSTIAKVSETLAATDIKNLTSGMRDIVALVNQIAAGEKGITFAGWVTAEDKIKGVSIAMKQAADAGKNATQVLLEFLRSADLATAIKVGAAFGLSEADVDRVRRFGTEVGDLFQKIKAEGVLISPASAAAFDRMRTSIQNVDSAWVRLKQSMESTIFATIAASFSATMNDIKASVINGTASIVEKLNEIGNEAIRVSGVIVSNIGTALREVAQEAGATDLFQGIFDQTRNEVTRLNSVIANLVGGIMKGMGLSAQSIKAVQDQINGVTQANERAGQTTQFVGMQFSRLGEVLQPVGNSARAAGESAQFAGQQFTQWGTVIGVTGEQAATAGEKSTTGITNVTTATQQATAATQTYGSTFGSINWDIISGVGVAAWNAITGAVQGAGTAITDFVSSLGSITWDAISSAGVAAWNALTGAIQGAIDAVLRYIGLKPSTPATGGGAPGKAAGGLLGGRGTGTSDSNLAWVSRGEHIMPAAVVRQPGVLAFLEALRRGSGIPGYADGGQVGGGARLGGFIQSMGRAIGDVKNIWEALTNGMQGVVKQIDQVVGTTVESLRQLQLTLGIILGETLTAAQGRARGGLLGGRGTGTSDSNLAWVSRGEHIMPARAVGQPGVLAFLEALRRSGGNLRGVLDGMGRFALGGMVPRPAMAFAGGGLAGGMSNVTIQFPGLPAIGGLRASSDVVDQLHRAAALAQVRSGGRKPSRYS